MCMMQMTIISLMLFVPTLLFSLETHAETGQSERAKMSTIGTNVRETYRLCLTYIILLF